MKIKVALFFAISMWVGYTLFGANFSAKMGAIDDHEVVSFLGPDQNIQIAEIPSLLRETEVGRWGQALRYRPVYYTLRIVESMLWKDNAVAWYGTRLVLFAIFLTTIWLLLNPYIGTVGSVAFLAYVLAWDYWKDIWTRLGPSEIYCVPALLLFGLAMRAILTSTKSSWQNWILLLLSFVVCVGSKENFFFLLLPLAYLVIRKWNSLNAILKAGSVATILFSVYVIAAMYFATKAAGTTFYHESLSLQERVELAVSMSPRIFYRYKSLQVALVVFFGSMLAYFKTKIGGRKDIIRAAYPYLVMMILMGIVVGSQVFFYGAMWPANNRYDFPGVLAIQISLLLSVLWIIRLLKIKQMWTPRKICQICLVGYMVVWSFNKGYFPIQNAAKQNAANTAQYQNQLSTVYQLIKSNPQSLVIFETNSPGTYEKIAATRRYLLYYGAPQLMYFNYSGETSSDSLYGALSKTMTDISVNGGEIKDDAWGFRPFKEMPSGAECIGIVFGETKSVCLTYVNF